MCSVQPVVAIYVKRGGKLYLDRVSVYNVQSHKLQWRSRKVVSLVDLLPPKSYVRRGAPTILKSSYWYQKSTRAECVCN